MFGNPLPINRTVVGRPVDSGEYFLAADGRYVCWDDEKSGLRMGEKNHSSLRPLRFVVTESLSTSARDQSIRPFTLCEKETLKYVVVVDGKLTLEHRPSKSFRYFPSGEGKLANFDSEDETIRLWSIVDKGEIICTDEDDGYYLPEIFQFVEAQDELPALSVPYIQPNNGVYTIMVDGMDDRFLAPLASDKKSTPLVMSQVTSNKIDNLPRFVLKNEIACANGKYLFSLKHVATDLYVRRSQYGDSLICDGTTGQGKLSLFFMTEDGKIGCKHSLKNYRGFKNYWEVSDFKISRRGDRREHSPAQFKLVRMDLKRTVRSLPIPLLIRFLCYLLAFLLRPSFLIYCLY